jgi:hypothetical protein
MKKIVRLTESDLHRIVKESVKRALNESNESHLLKVLCYELINNSGKLKPKVNVEEVGDIEDEYDVNIEFNGGYISATGFDYGDGFSLESADVSVNGQSFNVDGYTADGKMLSKCVNLIKDGLYDI